MNTKSIKWPNIPQTLLILESVAYLLIADSASMHSSRLIEEIKVSSHRPAPAFWEYLTNRAKPCFLEPSPKSHNTNPNAINRSFLHSFTQNEWRVFFLVAVSNNSTCSTTGVFLAVFGWRSLTPCIRTVFLNFFHVVYLEYGFLSLHIVYIIVFYGYITFYYSDMLEFL